MRYQNRVPDRNEGGMTVRWRDWFELSRPCFHTVGVLPFVLGTTLSWRLGTSIHWPVFFLGLLAVILLMLATYWGGEAYDLEEDRLARCHGSSRFSGGSGIVVSGRVTSTQVQRLSLFALLSACLIGVLIQFGEKTGPWTLPLGAAGTAAGYYYAAPPFRWVKRGVGEVLVGFCYGWLPVAASFYLQTGFLDRLVHWLSLPIGCTIFNVILLNEFPDYPADCLAGKRNLVVRLGRKSSSHLYGTALLLAWIFLIVGIRAGVPLYLLLLVSPLFVMGGKVYLDLRNGAFRNHQTLEKLCQHNLLINLGTTALTVLAVALWV